MDSPSERLAPLYLGSDYSEAEDIYWGQINSEIPDGAPTKIQRLFILDRSDARKCAAVRFPLLLAMRGRQIDWFPQNLLVQAGESASPDKFVIDPCLF